MKTKIYVGLSGASGRMGLAIKQVIKEKNSGLVLSAGSTKDFKAWENKKIQAVVDFSAPPLFETALKWCIKNKKPFVSGTTALKARHKKLLKTAAKRIPVFYEENMSWGIWFIKQAITNFASDSTSLLIKDIHHKHKKDKPSGTALKLKRAFSLSQQKKLLIESERRGRVFGIHQIYFKNPEEQVLIEHKALDRKLFARGALKALKWLVKKPKGFYSFDDLYKF